MSYVEEMVKCVTTRRETVAVRCDGCGATEPYGVTSEFTHVTIGVGDTDDGGGWNELDFCNACLIARTPALAAAGSTAPLVVGYPEDHPQG
jgi:hypothetical protein